MAELVSAAKARPPRTKTLRTHASDALIGLTTDHLLPAAAAGATLLAWTLAFALAATALTARRDVN